MAISAIKSAPGAVPLRFMAMGVFGWHAPEAQPAVVFVQFDAKRMRLRKFSRLYISSICVLLLNWLENISEKSPARMPIIPSATNTETSENPR